MHVYVYNYYQNSLVAFSSSVTVLNSTYDGTVK